MICDKCGENRTLFKIAGEEENLERTIGWCKECIDAEPRLVGIEYNEEEKGELRRFQKHPVDWYKCIEIKDEEILEELGRD